MRIFVIYVYKYFSRLHTIHNLFYLNSVWPTYKFLAENDEEGRPQRKQLDVVVFHFVFFCGIRIDECAMRAWFCLPRKRISYSVKKIPTLICNAKVTQKIKMTLKQAVEMHFRNIFLFRKIAINFHLIFIVIKAYRY